jgi:hypothetical protein
MTFEWNTGLPTGRMATARPLGAVNKHGQIWLNLACKGITAFADTGYVQLGYDAATGRMAVRSLVPDCDGAQPFQWKEGISGAISAKRILRRWGILPTKTVHYNAEWSTDEAILILTPISSDDGRSQSEG